MGQTGLTTYIDVLLNKFCVGSFKEEMRTYFQFKNSETLTYKKDL